MSYITESRGRAARPPTAFTRSAVVAVSLLSLGLVACQSPPQPLPPAAPAVPGSAPGPARGAGAFEWSSSADRVESELRSLARAGGPFVARSTDQRVWLVLPGDATFEPGRSALQPGARAWLDRVAAAVRGWPTAEVRIVGHTDATGTAAANDALSLDRAASVRDWMVARGVPAPRIGVAGRGAREAGTGAPGGDRRVEILIGERSGR